MIPSLLYMAPRCFSAVLFFDGVVEFAFKAWASLTAFYLQFNFSVAWVTLYLALKAVSDTQE